MNTTKQKTWEILLTRINKDQGSVLNQFAEQLYKDKQALTDHQKVSPCALFAPHLNTLIDKKTQFAHQLAALLYPPAENQNNPYCVVKTVDKKVRYMLYRRLIVACRKAYQAQQTKPLKKFTIYQEARLNGDRAVFYRLQTDPKIADHILNPQAMPVEKPALKVFTPFFDFLKNDQAVLTESLSFQRGTQFNDGRMDLCKQVVADHCIDPLMQALKPNKTIKHFLLGNNMIGLTGAKAIAEFIKHPQGSKIKTWYLAGNDINGEGMILLSRALQNETHCKALWLKRNPLKSTGAKALSDLLKNNQQLKILDLHNTGLLDQGVDLLFDGLKHNQTLRFLYLDANAITPKGAKSMAAYFDDLVQRQRKGITSFWLSMNRLAEQGIIDLAKSLKNYPHLKRLCLGSNRMSPNAAKILLRCLTDHHQLIYLDLGLYKATSDMHELPNNLGDDAVNALCDFIIQNKSVKMMSIRDNNISLTGLEKIATALAMNQTMLDFNFQQLGLKIPQNLIQKINVILARNIQAVYGIDQRTFQKQKRRDLKHTPAIRHIDSIYRNKSCTLH